MWRANLLALIFCVSHTLVAGQTVAATTAAAAATTASNFASQVRAEHAAATQGPGGAEAAEAVSPTESAPSRWVSAQTTLPVKDLQGPGSVAVDDTANVFVVNQDHKGIIRINSHDGILTIDRISCDSPPQTARCGRLQTPSCHSCRLTHLCGRMHSCRLRHDHPRQCASSAPVPDGHKCLRAEACDYCAEGHRPCPERRHLLLRHAPQQPLQSHPVGYQSLSLACPMYPSKL